MSEAMYNKMRERWHDFLNAKTYLEEPTDLDHLFTLYDDLVYNFCNDYGYSDKTREWAFSRWVDTFQDDYCKILHKEGWKGFAVCDEEGIK